MEFEEWWSTLAPPRAAPPLCNSHQPAPWRPAAISVSARGWLQICTPSQPADRPFTGHCNMALACRASAPSVAPAPVQQRSHRILPARCPAAAGAGSGRQQQRHQRQQQWRQRPQHVCSASGSATSSSEAQQLLDQFWQARGVVDEQQRRQLVAAAGGMQAQSEQDYRQLELPTASAAWFLEEGASPEVGGSAACCSYWMHCNEVHCCAALHCACVCLNTAAAAGRVPRASGWG